MSDTLSNRRGRGPSAAKAKKMLHDNSAQGHALTKKQRGFFGAIVGGDSTGPDDMDADEMPMHKRMKKRGGRGRK